MTNTRSIITNPFGGMKNYLVDHLLKYRLPTPSPIIYAVDIFTNGTISVAKISLKKVVGLTDIRLHSSSKTGKFNASIFNASAPFSAPAVTSNVRIASYRYEMGQNVTVYTQKVLIRVRTCTGQDHACHMHTQHYYAY